MLSSTITRTTAKAIFDAMYAHSPTGSVLPPSSVISPDTVAQTHVSFLGQSLFPTDDWIAASRASHAEVTSPDSRRRPAQRGSSTRPSVNLPVAHSPSAVTPPHGSPPDHLAFSLSTFEGGSHTPPVPLEEGGCRSASPELSVTHSPRLVIPPLGLLSEELAYSPSSFGGAAHTPPVPHEDGG